MLEELRQKSEAKKIQIDVDTLTYKQDIAEVLEYAGEDANIFRKNIAKVFIKAIQKEMKHGFVKAEIFGSVSRNQSTHTSDIDILLCIQRFTSQEKKDHNAFVKVQERGGVYNVAYNSHRVGELALFFEQKTGVHIHVQFVHEEDFAHKKAKLKSLWIH